MGYYFVVLNSLKMFGYAKTANKQTVKLTSKIELKSLWSALILMAVLVIQHDFIEYHSNTDEFYSAIACVDLKL